MKKKLLAGIVAIMMTIPLLFVAAAPAQAACVAKTSTKYDYAALPNDELVRYAKFYVTIGYNDCGNYRIFKWVKQGYAPDTRYSSSIKCNGGSGTVDAVRMNLGPILGHNPGVWERDCYPYGNSILYNWANVTLWDWEGGDRCTGSHWTAVVPYWWDPNGDVPAACF